MGRSSWTQTISVLLAIVVACLSGFAWIKADHQEVLDIIRKNQHNQDIFNRAVTTRFTTAGWARKEMSDWRNNLEEVADHPIPPIELMEFTLPFAGSGGLKK